MQPIPATSVMARKTLRSWFDAVSGALESGETVKITRAERRHDDFKDLIANYGTARYREELGVARYCYIKIVEKGHLFWLTLMIQSDTSIANWALRRQPFRPSEVENRKVVHPLIEVECPNCGAYLEVHFDVQESCDSCGAITFQRRWWAWNPTSSEWCRIDKIDD